MSPLTRRATAVYRQASAEHLERGAAWYPDAHEVARSQANEHGVTLEVASGVLAALSPRLGWGANVMLAERVLAHRGTLTRGALSNSLSAANRIYIGEAPLDVLGGLKTRAFYQAILTAGESEDPVIDRHAWDMLVGERLAAPPTKKQYREAAERMRRAADILGQSVSHVQAVTWVAWRARYWSDDAFAVAS